MPNFRGSRIPVPSDLNIPMWRELAADFSDQRVIDFLEFGFPINHDGEREFSTNRIKNHRGALDFPEAVDMYISSELDQGTLAGPFRCNPLPVPLALSPVNTVPKSNQIDRRFIVDLKTSGVNEGIDKESYLGVPYQLHLPTVDAFVELINERGPGCLLFKRDLSWAYRQFPVDPGDWDKLGFVWRDELYIDRRLSMGLRSAVISCQGSGEVVGFIYKKCRGHPVVVYIDDFNGVSSSDPEVAQGDFQYLGELLETLGLQEATRKAVPPGTRRVLLGVMFDTVAMTIEVSPERVADTLTLTDRWASQSRATKQQVQQMVGKLIFICKCVRQGRVFLNRLLSFLRGFSDEQKTRSIPWKAKLDVMWFNKYLKEYNGISIIPSQHWGAPDAVIATDACLLGCGGTCSNQFFHSPFPQEVWERRYHISELEMLTVVAAIKLWSQQCKGLNISIYCDNEATVIAINSGRCRNEAMHACLRELAYVTVTHECQLRATHIRGKDNRIPDFLSRWELGQEFRQRFYRETSGEVWREVRLPTEAFSFSHVW